MLVLVVLSYRHNQIAVWVNSSGSELHNARNLSLTLTCKIYSTHISIVTQTRLNNFDLTSRVRCNNLLCEDGNAAGKTEEDGGERWLRRQGWRDMRRRWGGDFTTGQ